MTFCQKSSRETEGSALDLAHLFGQHPQRAVQAHAPVDAADGARVDAPALHAAAGLATPQGVLLHLCARRVYVERRLVGVIASSEQT